jgi:Mrp family chromosome partitioning ATPase
MSKLTSERMRLLLEESESKFDWVLLDAPPVGLMADANLLARLTHGVLFVISAGTTSYGSIDRAIAELGRERIIGTVLNRVDDGQIPGDYQYYASAPAAK